MSHGSIIDFSIWRFATTHNLCLANESQINSPNVINVRFYLLPFAIAPRGIRMLFQFVCFILLLNLLGFFFGVCIHPAAMESNKKQ